MVTLSHRKRMNDSWKHGFTGQKVISICGKELLDENWPNFREEFFEFLICRIIKLNSIDPLR